MPNLGFISCGLESNEINTFCNLSQSNQPIRCLSKLPKTRNGLSLEDCHASTLPTLSISGLQELDPSSQLS